MRKTLIYFVILFILGFGIYYFLIKDNASPYSASEAGFNIKDTGSIGKIFLATNAGESVLLERTDSGWMVNKRYRALPGTLRILMLTLYQQYALYPVTKNAYDNVIKEMSTDGIKVEVYDRSGTKMKVFYVGGVAVNNSGTNMMMDNATTPYVVQVQGFNGYLSARYTTRLRDWRDRTIVNLPDNEIKSVSVQYAGKPINSFVIARGKDSTISVTGDPQITKTLDGLNTRKCKVYLKYFTNINCEGYLNGFAGTDTAIRNAPKQSTIDIQGIHGQHQHIDIYWMALNRRSKNSTVPDRDVPDEYDADRLYAVINDGTDTVLIQQYVFKKIFRNCAEFFLKDDALSPNGQQSEKDMNLMHKPL